MNTVCTNFCDENAVILFRGSQIGLSRTDATPSVPVVLAIPASHQANVVRMTVAPTCSQEDVNCIHENACTSSISGVDWILCVSVML